MPYTYVYFGTSGLSTTTADGATARLQTVPRLLDAGASGGPTLNGCLLPVSVLLLLSKLSTG